MYNLWVSEWVGGWVSEWVSEWSEWVSEYVINHPQIKGPRVHVGVGEVVTPKFDRQQLWLLCRRRGETASHQLTLEPRTARCTISPSNGPIIKIFDVTNDKSYKSWKIRRYQPTHLFVPFAGVGRALGQITEVGEGWQMWASLKMDDFFSVISDGFSTCDCWYLGKH